MSAAERTVRVAVALLPRALRDRYREQWNSDLRDAPEAGIRTSDIALGSLAFATTLARPMPWSGRTAAPDAVDKRSRLAFALGLSAALLALSQSARDPWYSNTAGNTVLEFFAFFVTELLNAFGILAPIVAIVLVTATRGVDRPVRISVWLLAAASLTALAPAAIDTYAFFAEGAPSWAGPLVSGAGIVVVLVAVRLSWRSLHPSAVRGQRRVASALVAAGGVLAVGALGLAHSMSLWAGRTIPVFSWEPWIVGSGVPPVFEEIIPTQAMYDEWLQHNEGFEQIVHATFAGWAVATVVLTAALVALVLRSRIRPLLLVVGAVSVQLIAHGGVTAFLHGAVSSSPDIAPTALILIGRLGLVFAVMVGVGGLRLARSGAVVGLGARAAGPPGSV